MNAASAPSRALAASIALWAFLSAPAAQAGAPAHRASTPAAVKPATGPAWNDLSADQKQILAPLQPTWDGMTDIGRRKWVQIAQRYPKMKPEEQKKLQERMAAWSKLTPAQRQLARQNYQASRNLAPEARFQAWERYQSLPDERKKQLAEADKARNKPTLVTAPPNRDPQVARNAAEIAKRKHHNEAEAKRLAAAKTGAQPGAPAAVAAPGGAVQAAAPAAAQPVAAPAAAPAPQ
ncbi:MAG: DUF3106 domain-containing protein [Candidatus Protistobacter heckmanni]|nr:DUF3106 domain-containing protein [Candidatus Protistobacter heckmanni]